MSSLCCLPLLSSWNNEHLSKLLINTHPQENKIMLPANRLCEYMLALLFCFWLLLSSWDDSIWQQNSKTFTSVTHKKKVCCICKSNLNIFVNLFHTVTGLYIGRNYPTLKKKKSLFTPTLVCSRTKWGSEFCWMQFTASWWYIILANEAEICWGCIRQLEKTPLDAVKVGLL